MAFTETLAAAVVLGSVAAVEGFLSIVAATQEMEAAGVGWFG
jgi:hypothetical protein